MNGFSCRIGSKHEDFSFFQDCDGDIIHHTISGTEVVTISDNPYTFAILDNEDYFCVFSGYLQYPLPDWTGGPPSDSALQAAKYLLQRFKETETDFLDGVYGHFVILIISKINGDVSITTDNCGNRRLFYNTTKEPQFSTHLGTFKNISSSSPDKDDTAFFLSYEFLPENRTIIQGVHYLDSNTILRSSQKKLTIEKKKVSPLPREPLLSDEVTAIDRLYDEFMKSIQRQMPSEKKVAVLLGGLDSALVAAALVSAGKEVETFSFWFENESYNQKFADELSQTIGCQHNWIEITPEIIKNGLLDYDKHFNHPSSISHYPIQINYLVKAIRKRDFTYCFTGDGCDDIFLGYPTVYKRARISQFLGWMPKSILMGIRAVLGIKRLESILGYSDRMTRHILLVLGRKLPVRGFVANRIFDEYSLKSLSQFFKSTPENSVEKRLSYIAHQYKSLSLIRLAFKGKSMVGTTRNKIEGASISNGVVIQSPYNDALFKNLAISIDESLLRPKEKQKSRAIGKYVFVEMVQKYHLLPKEIIFQKKASPVTSLIDVWLMKDLKSTILDLVTDCPFPVSKTYIQDIIKRRSIDNYFREKTLGKTLFQPVSLLITYSRFFQKKTERNSL